MTCAACLPGLICIPSWACPAEPNKPILIPIPLNKNARYYHDNKERLLEAARLHYQNNKERLQDVARKRRLDAITGT